MAHSQVITKSLLKPAADKPTVTVPRPKLVTKPVRPASSGEVYHKDTKKVTNEPTKIGKPTTKTIKPSEKGKKSEPEEVPEQ